MNYDGGSGRFGRDFNTSFTIPKMRMNADENRNMQQPVLDDVYGNYSQYPNPSATPTFNNQLESCFTRRSVTSNNSEQYLHPPETPTYKKQLEASRQGCYTRRPLKRTWDSGTPADQSYKSTFGDLYDPTLPKELLMLFQPLYCKLCASQLSSNVMAKTHYKSKNHDKKVRTWLTEYSEKTGQPLHQRAATPRPKKDEEYDRKHYHCDVCDLNLTGKSHAESHYMGKNHQRAVHGKKNPAGKGFHNDDGKWVRMVAAKDDPTGRDGFGQDFAVQERVAKALKPVDVAAVATKSAENILKCEVCGVFVTSAAQLDMHLQGQKHKKKVKHVKNGLTIASLMDEDDEEEGGCVAPTKAESDTLSSYRTPSGQFYCESCNLSLNSEVQFMQHLKSRKHSKQLTTATTPPPPPPPVQGYSSVTLEQKQLISKLFAENGLI